MLDLVDAIAVRELVAALPPRERELAELLMAGHTQVSAARALHISDRSARRMVVRLRRRYAAGD